MNKTLTVALAALIATGSLGVATAADAQSRQDLREYRQEQRQEDRAERREERRERRQENRAERRDDRQDYRRDHRHDRRDYRHDRRDDRHDYRRHQAQREQALQRQRLLMMQRQMQAQRQEQRAYARWQRAQHRYHAPRYVAPRGYQTRNWEYGQRMPSYYRSNAYVVNDYQRYGLQAPPYGHQYVRSGNDVVVAAAAGGLISAVIAGLFQ